MTETDQITIMKQMGFDDVVFTFEQCKHEEDEEMYAVWKVTAECGTYILKEAKGSELEAYCTFIGRGCSFAPGLIGHTSLHGREYILIEYMEGCNLQQCSRDRLRLALDSLILMQEKYWERKEFDSCCYSFEESIKGRRQRAEYLKDSVLENVYMDFMQLYCAIPRTLCHDDLLPFNVIVSDQKAALIDWEVCGMLPYPVSLARLIAHGTDDREDLFYMSREDREFAIQYYYDRLVARKGITYEVYRRTIDYFLFYEYCEWVFVGNKYDATDEEYYKKYIVLAKHAAGELNKKYKYY